MAAKKKATKRTITKAPKMGPTERKLVAMSAHLHSQEAQIRDQGATIARLVAAIETANANTGAFVSRATATLTNIESKVNTLASDNNAVKVRLGDIFGNG